jgi:hypothetical protein
MMIDISPMSWLAYWLIMIFQIPRCSQNLKKKLFKGKEAASIDVCGLIVYIKEETKTGIEILLNNMYWVSVTCAIRNHHLLCYLK